MDRSRRVTFMSVVLLMAIAAVAPAQTVTSPRQQFGFDIGDDYQLATYTQFVEYWRKLDAESDRMRVVDIGKTAEGRPQLMAIVTSPANFKKLDRYRQISRRLATVDGLTDEQARALAQEGKGIVWFDGGLHANEVLGAHQLIETVYQLVSRNDAETRRFLDDLVILAVHANPDGMELVSSWYMREKEPSKRTTSALPRLYQKHAGHDNNRDFYMSNLPESTNMNKVLYSEWYPQVMYNHHQTGPAGAVMFAPPFRDPFNFNFDPLVPIGVDVVGAAMANRMAAENKPGVTSRKGANYSTWWNGGLRTTVYFHNMIGLLTETIGSPTPIEIPFVPSKQLPDSSMPFPIEPQKTWRFRQSIDYSVTANYAVFDVVSRNKDTFLYNIFRMGKNSVERGSRDSWTATPRRILAAQAAVTKRAGETGAGVQGSTPAAPAAAQFTALLRDPAMRDPRGFVLPADQPDFGTAARFVNALLKTGITVHRATGPFAAAGRTYPAGSYVVKAAQAFRPHVLDMFEPQDHPDDIPYPGGPPTRPYDSAGWTLAFQMGVKFDRILEAFDGPFETVTGMQRPPRGVVSAPPGAVGFISSHAPNNAFIAINRLLAAGEEVSWLTTGQAPGAFFIPVKASTRKVVDGLAADLGLSFEGVPSRPSGEAVELRKLRVGLADLYGGSMPSGWTRFVLEQFEFPFEVVYPKVLDAGGLSKRFDVIILPSGVGPPMPSAARGTAGNDRADNPGSRSIPAEFEPMVGAYSVDRTAPQLKAFLEEGGTVLAVGRSGAALAEIFGLPVDNHLVDRSPDGAVRPLPPEKYYVPGSILRVAVDTTAPVAHGLESQVDVFFDNSPVFRLRPDAARAGVRAVAWFDGPAPLRSGWAYGQAYLDGGVQVVEAPVGKGRLFLFGPEITFRAQPHGTFKFLFNGLHLSGARPVPNTRPNGPR